MAPSSGSGWWDERRQRWLAIVTVGYDGRGKRRFKQTSAKTKTEAQRKLKELQRQVAAGEIDDAQVTVAQAVEDWLTFGLGDVSSATRVNYENLCRTHVIPLLGAYKLRDLRTSHVDEWLAERSNRLSKRTLKLLASLLNRAVRRAMAKDQVGRNVVEVATVPGGRPGRASKSLTVEQAKAILDGASQHPFYAYIVVSLLTGARTEELRALTWSRTHLNDDPPHIDVWRSVRSDGDTKTRRSRRSLALPARAAEALIAHRYAQAADRSAAGSDWDDNDLVFCTGTGAEMDATSARWYFRRALDGLPGIDPDQWTPRELRHSFVSILSAHKVPIEEISKLVGHSSITITETVYRKQIQTVVETGTTAMNDVFDQGDEAG